MSFEDLPEAVTIARRTYDSRSITGADVCGRCVDSEDGVINDE